MRWPLDPARCLVAFLIARPLYILLVLHRRFQSPPFHYTIDFIDFPSGNFMKFTRLINHFLSCFDQKAFTRYRHCNHFQWSLRIFWSELWCVMVNKTFSFNVLWLKFFSPEITKTENEAEMKKKRKWKQTLECSYTKLFCFVHMYIYLIVTTPVQTYRMLVPYFYEFKWRDERVMTMVVSDNII